jgi:hypothetical protein
LALTVQAAMAATVVQAVTAPVSQRPDLVRLHARVLMNPQHVLPLTAAKVPHQLPDSVVMLA